MSRKLLVLAVLAFASPSHAQEAWDVARLTNWSSYLNSPVYAADGSGVYFMGQNTTRTQSGLWFSDLDFTAPTLVISGAGRVRFSSDGTRVAYTDSSSNLWVAAANGSQAARVNGTTGGIGEFSIAPDGSRVVFSAQTTAGCCFHSAWIVNADGSGLHKLSNLPQDNVNKPTFAPDGHTVIMEGPGNSNSYGLWRVDADSGEHTQLLNGSLFTFTAGYSFTADSSQFYFVAWNNGSMTQDIYRMNVGGGGLVNITNAPDQQKGYPSLSPDGSRIAYQHGTGIEVVDLDSGDRFMAVVPVDASDRVSIASNDPAIWSPDAAGFLFTSTRSAPPPVGKLRQSDLFLATAPIDPCDVSPDSDGDGLLDCRDACAGDPGKTAPGVCGCGAVDPPGVEATYGALELDGLYWQGGESDAGLVLMATSDGFALWSNGALTPLGIEAPDGGWVSPADVNDHGQVVGILGTPDGSQHAFLWDAENGVQDLDELIGSDVLDGYTTGFSHARTIDNSGRIAIDRFDLDTGAYLGAVLDLRDGSLTDLGYFAEEDGTPAYGEPFHMNELGHAGADATGSYTHAMYYSPETGMLDLGEGEGVAINDLDQVIVTNGTSTLFDAAAGSTTPFTPLAGDDAAFALDLDDAGRAVGASYLENGTGAPHEYHALVWTTPEAPLDVDTLLDPSDPLAGVVHFHSCFLITNAGELHCSGTTDDDWGTERMYALEPLLAVADADDDGIGDACERCDDDPAKTEPGLCGCGAADDDSDGDGSADCEDGCPDDGAKTSAGACGCGAADDDSDGDSSADCEDGCPDDGAKTDAGVCGCGVADDDSDGDGFANCNDACPNDAGKTSAGACGCGTADTDSDGDGLANCNDACPNDAGKTSAGACGCGTADTDSDGDGLANCNDACPSQSPGGSDADHDGCPDGGAALADQAAGAMTAAITSAVTVVLTDPAVPDAAATGLRAALDAFIGNNGGKANNGFTDKVASGDWVAAVTQARACVLALRDAAARGYDTNALQRQVTAYARAAVALALSGLPATSPAVARALSHLAAGDARAAASDFLGALDSYKKAAQAL